VRTHVIFATPHVGNADAVPPQWEYENRIVRGIGDPVDEMTAPSESRRPWLKSPCLGSLKNNLTQLPSNLYAIWRIPVAEGRSAVCRTYLKILARLAFAGVFPRMSPRQERIGGVTMQALDYASFLSLYIEIVVRREYRFAFDSPSPLILDCGSNIGMSVLYFKTISPDCRIVAFEPDEIAFRALQHNVAANRWNHVEMHNAALCGEEGEIDFFSDPSQPGSLVMSTFEHRVSGASSKATVCRQVQSLRLSSFVNGPVDLVKMDIEGTELAVLEELAQTGKLQEIKQIVLEYHHHLHDQENRMARLLGLLEENGFGYQIHAPSARPFQQRAFQDILIYAYRPH
jgi:FkbM family methyltransferase